MFFFFFPVGINGSIHPKGRVLGVCFYSEAMLVNRGAINKGLIFTWPLLQLQHKAPGSHPQLHLSKQGASAPVGFPVLNKPGLNLVRMNQHTQLPPTALFCIVPGKASTCNL